MNQNEILEVEIRNVYGKGLLYPVNNVAKLFAKLLDVKTFSKQQIEDIKSLGYVVGQVRMEVVL
jgi:hypothetical protein